MVEIKFCGLTRPEDAARVAALGGAYAGVIFAGGPRCLEPARAARVLDAVEAPVRRVGVFGATPAAEIARIARALALDVVQLHAEPDASVVRQVAGETGCAVWGVVRIGAAVPPALAALDGVADAIVLDVLVAGGLGGSGRTFDWKLLTADARPRRSRVVAAGGLSSDNVQAAISALAPDVVDVSSGVERAPGVKDHDRMRAFADAVRRHSMER
ncbi:MAG TPA: hypothetical protein VF041_17185 [Gemmatimonadaceae bacterium]